MIKILRYIKAIFPSEWLSNIGEEVDEIGSAGVDINHPMNDEFELTVVILPERVGIGIIKKSEKDILVDLGGFDYSFEKDEDEKIRTLLSFFKEEARLPSPFHNKN